MKTPLTCVLMAWALSFGPSIGPCAELAITGLGPIQVEGPSWELLSGPWAEEPKPQVRFTVYQDRHNGDRLSFGVLEKSGRQIPDLNSMTDTAQQLFPNGLPVPGDRGEHWKSVTPLRWPIRNLGWTDSDSGVSVHQDVLEVSFIAEHEDPQRNLLAHSSVLFGDVTVFVQHTSRRVITSAFARQVAVKALQRLVTVSDSNNLKPATTAAGREAAQKCRENLRLLQGVKAIWALENRKTDSDISTDADLFGADKYIRIKPSCPSGGNYSLGTVVDKTRCSIAGHFF